MSLRKAVNDKCRECLYDPLSNGNWRQQITACTSPNCPLFPFRPISKSKGCANRAIFGVEINERGRGQYEVGLSSNITEKGEIGAAIDAELIDCLRLQ